MTGLQMPTPRGPLDHPDVVELLDRADRAVDALVTPVTAEEGLSREGWRILLLLSKHGCRTMGEVAEHAAIPGPTATRVVDRLVTQGLAVRRIDSADRRRILVHLAPDGQQVVDRVSRQLARRIGALLGELSHGGVGALLVSLANGMPDAAE